MAYPYRVLLVDKGTLAVVERRIDREHEEMQYRPVVVAIIESPQSDLLFLQRTSWDDWSFPQGGVNEGEDTIDALLRSVWEEVKISPDGLTIRKYCHGDRIDTPDRQPGGFRKGESFFYFHLLCDSMPKVVVDSRICGYRWVSSGEAPALALLLLSASATEKKRSRSMYFALKSALLP